MLRQELWELLKKSGITQSKLRDVPKDVDLKIVIQHAPIRAKYLIDFICALDNKERLDKICKEPKLSDEADTPLFGE